MRGFAKLWALGALGTGAVGLGVGVWLGGNLAAARYEPELRSHAEGLRDQALAYAEGWVRAVEDARADAEAESGRRAETALRHARAEAGAREARLRGQIHAMEDSRLECAWSDGRVRLLNDAVRAANGDGAADPDAAALGMRAKLPAAAAADEP